MNIKGNEIRWNFVPKGDFYCQIEGFKPGEKHYWECCTNLKELESGNTVNLKIVKVAVWGTNPCRKSGSIINVNIAPGKTQEWRRQYEFFTY